MFRKSAQPSKEKQRDRVTITDAGPCRKSLRLQVGLEVMTPIRTGVLQDVQKQAILPGFRKGKAPLELVEKHHAQTVQEQTLHRVTKQTLEQVVKEQGLRPVGPFEVTRAEFREGEGLTLEAVVEIEPDFTLGSYRQIPLIRASEAVTPEEVAGALAKLQDSMAQLVPGKEGEPKQRQVPNLDEEFAKDLGFESLEKLRAHVEAKLREQKRAAARQGLEAALFEELLVRHTFEVPPRLVSHQTERLTRDFKARLLLAGTPEAHVDEEAVKFTERLRTNAERHVKLGFILDRIATQEAVDVTQQELVGRLWDLARRWQKDPAEVRQLLDAQGLWPSVVSTIRQEKTVALLLSAAKITNGTASVTEVKPQQ